MNFVEYAPLVDTALVLALALIVWVAYRELRARSSRRMTPEV